MKSKQIVYLLLVFAIILLGTGCASQTPDVGEMRSISVTGSGSVTHRPDTASFTVGYQFRAETTREAQQQVASRMQQVMGLLEQRGIPDEHVALQRLSVSPEYRWVDNQRELVGQRASQSVRIELKYLDEKGTELAELFDALGEIQGIEISAVSFSISNESELKMEARQRAFEQAKEKARQLAELSGMELGKPILISEDVRDAYEPVYRTMAMDAAESASSVVPPGMMEVTSQVSVKFEIR